MTQDAKFNSKVPKSIIHIAERIDKDRNVLGLDFNEWTHHNFATLDILCHFNVIGFKSFYFKDNLGHFPSYVKPFFGSKNNIERNVLIGHTIVDLNTPKISSPEMLFSQEVQQILQEDLSKVNNQRQLIDIRHGNFDIGYSILSSLASQYGLGELPRSLIKNQAPKKLQEYISTCNLVYTLLRENSIGCLVVFNGRFLKENAAWRTAQFSGIPVLFHESSKNFSYIVSESRPHSIEGYGELASLLTENVEINEIKELSNLWFESRLGGQNPDSETFQKRWKARNQLSRNPDKRGRISIFTTSDDEYIGVSPEWDLPEKVSQKEWINRIILLGLEYNYEVVLRLHPNLSTKSRLLRRSWQRLGRVDELILLSYTSSVNSYDLIKSSDLVITCGSTIAMEAGYLKIPVLSIGTGLYDGINGVHKIQDLQQIEKIFSEGDFSKLLIQPSKTDIFGYVETTKFNEPSYFTRNLSYYGTNSLCPNFLNKFISKIFRVTRYLRYK
jgi:hypothetical protein